MKVTIYRGASGFPTVVVEGKDAAKVAAAYLKAMSLLNKK
uniref:Uncharacterized protein n=1 Tax=viral metagenome TaxID=1070528 RepID=A0A6M3K9Y2_9ZZZZ